MRIERYQSRRRQAFPGCGCGLITLGGFTIFAIIVVLIAPAFPAIGLRLAGFQPIEQPIVSSTAENIPAINSAQSASQVILSAGTYGQETITSSTAFTMQIGMDNSDESIAQIKLTESGIDIVCSQYTDVCSATGNRFRNVTVNLQNNQASISGEAFITGLNTWQALSVLVSVTPQNTIAVEGLEVNGVLFGIPDDELGQRLSDVQQSANQILSQLTLQTNGETYHLSDVIITETQLVATFR